MLAACRTFALPGEPPGKIGASNVGPVPVSHFRPINRDVDFLLPPSVQDWLPEGHLARYVVEVVEGLDLSELARAYAGRGSLPLPPSEPSESETIFVSSEMAFLSNGTIFPLSCSFLNLEMISSM